MALRNWHRVDIQKLKDDPERLETIFKPMTTKEIVTSMLQVWRNHPIILKMIESQAYYRIENVEIDKKSRDFRDSSNNIVKQPHLSNEKIPAGFLRFSANQKVNYGFSNRFTLSVERIDPVEVTGKEDETEDRLAKEYQKIWDSICTEEMHSTITRVVRQAVVNGIGWAGIWLDPREDGLFKLECYDSETIYPAWGNKTHTILNDLVRDYPVLLWGVDKQEEVKKVEYWNDDIVERYIDFGGGGLQEDAEWSLSNPEQVIGSHLTRTVSDESGEEQKIGETWGKIPFLSLKGTDDELPLLALMKHQLDAYDKLQSKSTDSLIDDIDPLLVIENITTNFQDLSIARETIKNSRIMSTDEGGKAYYVQVNTDIAATQSKLESLKKDIHQFSSTVDTQDIKFGSNPSGVALKSAFQDLDTYVNGLETEFKLFIKKMKYFVDKWIDWTGKMTLEQCQEFKVVVELDRDMMINTAEEYDNTAKLAATNPNYVVSTETIDNINPAVQSHEIEQERREKEEPEDDETSEMARLRAELEGELDDESDDKTGSREDATAASAEEDNQGNR